MKKISFVLFFLFLFFNFAFSEESNTKSCKNLDKKRFRINQENVIDILKPVNVYIKVSGLINRVEIEGVKDKTMDIKVDSRLHLLTNINNFTVDVKKKGNDIFIETNYYPSDKRLKFCEKSGRSVIYIKLPQKNISLLTFKGFNTELNCNKLVVDKVRVKSKFKDTLFKDCTFSELSIKTYEGDTTIYNVRADKLSFYGGFGDVFLKDSTLSNIFFTLLSGDIETYGRVSISKGKVQTTFGDIDMDLERFNSLEFQTKSGDIRLSLQSPEKTRFKAHTDFGDFYFRFKKPEGFNVKNNTLEYGNNKMPEIKISTQSGDIEIFKRE